MTRTAPLRLRFSQPAILLILCLLPLLALSEGRTPWDVGVDWQGDHFIYRMSRGSLIDSCYLYASDSYGVRLYKIQEDEGHVELQLCDEERAQASGQSLLKLYGDTLLVASVNRIYLFYREGDSLVRIHEGQYPYYSPYYISDSRLMITAMGIYDLHDLTNPQLVDSSSHTPYRAIIVGDRKYNVVVSSLRGNPLVVSDVSDPANPTVIQTIAPSTFGDHGIDGFTPVYLDSVLAFPEREAIRFVKLDENGEVVDTCSWNYYAHYPERYRYQISWLGVIADTLLGAFSPVTYQDQGPQLFLFDPDEDLENMHIATVQFEEEVATDYWISSPACCADDSLLFINHLRCPHTLLYSIADMDSARLLYDSTEWNNSAQSPQYSLLMVTDGILAVDENDFRTSLYSLTGSNAPELLVSLSENRTLSCGSPDFLYPYYVFCAEEPPQYHWLLYDVSDYDSMEFIYDFGTHGGGGAHPNAKLYEADNHLYCAIRGMDEIVIYEIHNNNVDSVTIDLPDYMYSAAGLAWDEDGLFVHRNDTLRWYDINFPEPYRLHQLIYSPYRGNTNSPPNPLFKNNAWVAIYNQVFHIEDDSLRLIHTIPGENRTLYPEILDLDSDRLVYWMADANGGTATVLNLHDGCYTDTTAYMLEAGHAADLIGDTLWLVGTNGLMRFELTGYSDTPEESSTSSKLPTTTQLEPAFPNPFNPSVTIPFTLASSQRLSIEIFDILGRRVTTLTEGLIPAGHHQVQWQGKSSSGQMVSAGTYFVRMRYDGGESVRKVLLLK